MTSNYSKFTGGSSSISNAARPSTGIGTNKYANPTVAGTGAKPMTSFSGGANPVANKPMTSYSNNPVKSSVSG